MLLARTLVVSCFLECSVKVGLVLRSQRSVCRVVEEQVAPAGEAGEESSLTRCEGHSDPTRVQHRFAPLLRTHEPPQQRGRGGANTPPGGDEESDNFRRPEQQFVFVLFVELIVELLSPERLTSLRRPTNGGSPLGIVGNGVTSILGVT